MKEMGKIPNEMKAEYGKKVNEIKTWAQEQFDELDKKLKEAEMRLRYETENIAEAIPATPPLTTCAGKMNDAQPNE